MKTKFTGNLTRMSVLALVLVACVEKFEYQTRDLNSPNKIFPGNLEVSYNGRFLEFTSPKSFDRTVAQLQKGEAQLFKSWMNQVDFMPQERILMVAMNEQKEYLKSIGENLNAISKDELARMIKSNSDHLKRFEDLFVVDDYGIIRDLRVFHPLMAAVVNENGIVKIGGILFQYNEFNYKMIRDGDLKKLPAMYASETNNDKLGIVVVPLNSTKKRQEGERLTHHSYKTVEVSNPAWLGPDLRITGEIHITVVSTAVYSDVCYWYCPPPDGGGREEPGSNCTCVYSIVGYQDYTLYTSKMIVENQFLWTWQLYQPDWSEIIVDWSVDGQPQGTNVSTSYWVSTTNAVVYWGPTRNVTSAYHTFRFWNNYDPFGSNWDSREIHDWFND